MQLSMNLVFIWSYNLGDIERLGQETEQVNSLDGAAAADAARIRTGVAGFTRIANDTACQRYNRNTRC